MSKDKIRLYQLAKELDVDSADLIDALASAGKIVKNHMTTIDSETRQLAEDILSGRVKIPASRPSAPVEAKSEPRLVTPSTPASIPAPRTNKVAEIPKAKGAAGKSSGAVEEQPAVEVAEEMPVEVVAAAPTPVAEPEPEIAVEEPPVVEAKPEEPPVEEPPPPEVTASPAPEKAPPEKKAPEKKVSPPIAPIPSPIKPLGQIPTAASRPAQMGTPTGAGAGASGAGTSALGQKMRELRAQRQNQRQTRRPIVAAPPPMVRRLEPGGAKSEGPVQKPIVRLSAQELRQGRVNYSDLVPNVGVPRPDAGGPPGPLETRKKHSDIPDRDDPKRRKVSVKDRRKRNVLDDDRDDQSPRRQLRNRAGKIVPSGPRGPVMLETPISIRSFSEAAGIRSSQLQSKLMAIGIMSATINATLNEEQAELLAADLGIQIQIKKAKTVESVFDLGVAVQDQSEDLVLRPPIVTFMGHVDHGKTSLMDRIRKANVASGEAGGITQHVGAYQVKLDDEHAVTFLDTPGHEAFTSMRARGANLTDIVVLVVAADDGVMPQTEEAANHAKAAGVAIVVAMNKIDLPQAKPDRLMQQLAKIGLNPEAWGGDTICIGTSATTGVGIEELLENISLVAELKELKANPKRPALGTCIEASLSEGRGVQATILVQNGTLRRGDIIVCGGAFGRVRAMFDEHKKPILEAGPSTPAVVIGLDSVPPAGERFLCVDDLSVARQISEERREKALADSHSARHHVTLEKFYEALQDKKVRELLIILKSDVRGSLEAIKKELGNLQHEEVRLRIIHEGVGGITESDVLLADASDAIIIGFHVAADDRARAMASDKGVEIRTYDIIYQVSDEVKSALEGLLKPETREVQLGRAVIQKVFTISRVGSIAGCRVIQGTIERSASCRVIRDGVVIGTYPLAALRHFKDDVKEVREGKECGIKLHNFDDVKDGDVLEAFKIEEIKRTL